MEKERRKSSHLRQRAKRERTTALFRTGKKRSASTMRKKARKNMRKRSMRSIRLLKKRAKLREGLLQRSKSR